MARTLHPCCCMLASVIRSSGADLRRPTTARLPGEAARAHQAALQEPEANRRCLRQQHR